VATQNFGLFEVPDARLLGERMVKVAQQRTEHWPYLDNGTGAYFLHYLYGDQA
jgi:hypothetical protein